jgi:hypothetical protein
LWTSWLSHSQLTLARQDVFRQGIVSGSHVIVT